MDNKSKGGCFVEHCRTTSQVQVTENTVTKSEAVTIDEKSATKFTLGVKNQDLLPGAVVGALLGGMLLGAAFTAFSFIYLRRRRQEQFVCNEQISHAEHNLRYEAGDNLIMPRVEERRSNVYCEIKDERQFSTKLSFVPPNNRELNGPGPRSKEYNMYDHLHETNTAESGNVYSRTTPEPSVVSAHQGNNTASSRTDIDNLDKREDDLTSDGRSKEFPDEKEGTAIYFVLEKEIK